MANRRSKRTRTNQHYIRLAALLFILIAAIAGVVYAVMPKKNAEPSVKISTSGASKKAAQSQNASSIKSADQTLESTTSTSESKSTAVSSSA